MEFVQLTLDDWLAEKEALRKDLNSAVEAFVRIGYRLRKIRDTESYKLDGYKSLSEFAKAEYGIEKSTTSTFMAINEEFSKDGFSLELQDRYKGMGSSILAEMLKLPDQDRELITVDTTRAQIRELKSFNKQENPEDNQLKDVLIELFRDKKNFLNQYYMDQGRDLEDLVYLFNPNGNMTFRKGKYMLFFYDLEQGIKYKVFGDSQNYQLTYEEFFHMVQNIFPDEGNRTYETFYGEQEEEKREQKITPVLVNTPCGGDLDAAKQEKQIHEQDEKNYESTGNHLLPVDSAEEETQIPGQKEIEDYPEVLPKGYQAENSIAFTESERNLPDREVSEEQKTEICEEIQVVKEPHPVPPAEPESRINTPCEEDSELEIHPEERLSRKEYLDRCDAWSTALYLSKWYNENPEHAQRLLLNPNNLKRWLDRRVEPDGKEI